MLLDRSIRDRWRMIVQSSFDGVMTGNSELSKKDFKDSYTVETRRNVLLLQSFEALLSWYSSTPPVGRAQYRIDDDFNIIKASVQMISTLQRLVLAQRKPSLI